MYNANAAALIRSAATRIAADVGVDAEEVIRAMGPNVDTVNYHAVQNAAFESAYSVAFSAHCDYLADGEE